MNKRKSDLDFIERRVTQRPPKNTREIQIQEWKEKHKESIKLILELTKKLW